MNHPIRKTAAIAALLCVLALGLLAGCKGVSQQLSPTPSPSPTPTAMPTATPEPTPTPTPEPTPVHEVDPITFGLSSGYAYQNEFFNIAVDVDDRWFVYTTEQYDTQNELTGLTKERQRQQAYLAKLSSGESVMDYDAILRTGLEEIVIKINDISLIKDDYPDPVSFQTALAKDVAAAFEADGTVIYDNEIKPVTIAGRQASCWVLSYAAEGYMVYNADISFWQGDYDIAIVLISTGKDRLDEMITMFRAMN